MLLPGPEAQQLAIYVGWLLNGLGGGLVAGTLFVLPGMVALLALSVIYVGFGDTAVVAALFGGLAPAVVAIVAQAVWRVGGRALTNRVLVGFSVLAFVALAVFAVPFRTAVRAWFRISLQTFGGPAGQIAVMQRTLVEEKRWIGHRRSLRALTTACCCPARRRSSWRSTPGGC